MEHTKYLGNGFVFIKSPESGSDELGVVASERDALNILFIKALVY